MTEYKCGHKTSGLIILDDNELSMSAYLQWIEEGNLKTREKCFDCFLKEISPSTSKK